MATILYISTYGSDDPTRASLAFVAALGAIDAGHTPQITLMGEAVNVMKDEIAAAIHGVGWPPFKELLDKTIAAGIPLDI